MIELFHTYSEFVFRLFLALILSGWIGYERSIKSRAAGLRTHALVGTASALVMLTSEYIFQHYSIIGATPDPARLGAQVISGIGFLGAGTILREKGSVRGLTTAATLWIVACLGLAVGRGLYALSLTSAVIIFIILSLFKKADRVIQKETKWRIRFRKKEKEDEVDEDYNITEGKNSEDVITLYEKVNEPISRE